MRIMNTAAAGDSDAGGQETGLIGKLLHATDSDEGNRFYMCSRHPGHGASAGAYAVAGAAQ